MNAPVYHLILKTRACLEEEAHQKMIRREQDLRMLAEQIRCAEISRRASRGEILVGNRDFDPENPFWMRQARARMEGEAEEDLLDSEEPRFVAQSMDHVSAYFEHMGQPGVRQQAHRQNHTYLKAQQRVNQRYATAIAPQFGVKKKTTRK